MTTLKEKTIEKILKMPPEQLQKLAIFLAGMEAEQDVKKNESA